MLYHENYSFVKNAVLRAMQHQESNSVLMLARTKQVLHSFVTFVSTKLQLILAQENYSSEFKVIRVNSILSNSESKILMKLSESLNLKSYKNTFNTQDMVETIKTYFESHPHVVVLFILEDIDYYVETTK
mmetsp:Transcript_39869/g.38424  ORF Transcript_39869/g.38424 Transcript_39869/m.38424 type:complete len:130 (+) Transcript_39869:201-590(+)